MDDQSNYHSFFPLNERGAAMSEMFIRLENGKPVDHPIMGVNFRRVFPHIDAENPGPDFAKFVRVSKKEAAGKYEVVIGGPTYQWVDGVVKDVWEIREMTPEEKAEVDLQEQLGMME